MPTDIPRCEENNADTVFNSLTSNPLKNRANSQIKTMQFDATRLQWGKYESYVFHSLCAKKVSFVRIGVIIHILYILPSRKTKRVANEAKQ